MNDSQNHSDKDFGTEIALLRESRPELSGLELDRVKKRVRDRARKPVTARGRTRAAGLVHTLRARTALIGVIAAGAVMTAGGGVALAVSGQSTGSGNASTAQYGHPKGPTVHQVSPAVTPAQVTQQVSTTTQPQLPFTGYAAIAVVALGLALLLTGLVLRYVSRRPRSGGSPPS